MSAAYFLHGSTVAGATYVFSQDIVDQVVDAACVVGRGVPLRGRVLVGFTSLCVVALREFLEVENGLLGCDASLRGGVDESLPDFCLGLAIPW